MSLSLLQRLEAAHTSALLGRLLAIADDAVIVVDAAHRIVLFNEGAGRAFGYRADAVIGQPLSLLIPELQRSVHTTHLETFARSPTAARRMADRTDIQGRRADGTHFDAEASIAHLDLDGDTYYAAILRDVTEQRRAARALSESEARFRQLADSAPVGIFTTDADGLCGYVNSRWCSIAGASDAAALGTGWFSLVHPDDRERVLSAWGDMLTTRSAFNARFRFVWPDGSTVWVLCNAVPSLDSDGRVQGYLGSVTDVSDAHRQAEALERARAETEAASKAKTLFLANMSHETRTPLNAVIGMSSLLLDTPLSEEQREYARTVRTSAESLLDLINDILDFSKADAGKLEIERIAFNLRSTVEESLDLVAPRAAEKGLHLAYLIEDGTPEHVLGDATRMRQILVNLLSNAVKFTHQGEVFVAVDAEPLSEPGRHRLRLSVHDTGIGIAAEHTPRLFQAFSQVDASTTRQYGGTGLGLAITKRLAELMDGEVTVESEPGRGSVFRVIVAVEAGTHPAGERPPLALANRRALIVDDNLSNRRALSRMTLACGMQARAFASVLEALDQIRLGERFDIALLDARVGHGSGVDAIAAEMPVVMLAPLGRRHTLESQLPLGPRAVLSKPLKLRELMTTMLRLLDEAHAGAPAPRPEGHEPRVPLASSLPLRVLVAEDNTVNQRVIESMLQRLGYRADLVANGLEALDAVERQPYDVVLMDIHMPELDGLQAARWIADRWPVGRRPRLVAMTANNWPTERARGMEATFDACLLKPIDLDRLEATLREVGPLPPSAPPPLRSAPPMVDTVLDHGRLEHLHALQDSGQPMLVRDLIDLFLADSPGHLRALDQALAHGSGERVREQAHRFLSATQNIGANRLSALCMNLEKAAQLDRLDQARGLLTAMVHEHVQVVAALQALRDQA